jgi:hypothetical protein
MYREKYRNYQELLHNANAIRTNRNDAYENYFFNDLLHFNSNLDNITLVADANQAILLKKMFLENEAEKLICRFSEFYCESCVSYAILKIKNRVDSLGKNNILFLGMYENNTSLKILKSQYNIQDMNVYNTGVLPLPAEKMGFPYYFMLDSTLRVTDVFVPDKAVPELTDRYLKMVEKKYFLRIRNENES